VAVVAVLPAARTGTALVSEIITLSAAGSLLTVWPLVRAAQAEATVTAQAAQGSPVKDSQAVAVTAPSVAAVAARPLSAGTIAATVGTASKAHWTTRRRITLVAAEDTTQGRVAWAAAVTLALLVQREPLTRAAAAARANTPRVEPVSLAVRES